MLTMLALVIPALLARASARVDVPQCRTDVSVGDCAFGASYKMKIVSSQEQCCDICSNDDACAAWSLKLAKDGKTMHCSFKNESCAGKRGGSCLANGMINPPPSPGPPPAGSYAVSMGSFKLPNGYYCGSDAPTDIWYPTQLDKGPFPILSFGHGAGGSMLLPLQKNVASLGFIIVAPKTACCNNHGDDILHSLDWTRGNFSQNTSLHEALAHVDWSRAGIYGHSFGSAWATDAVRKALKQPDVFNVKAALFSHGGHNASGITIPSMFTSGRGGGADQGMFDSSPAKYKVFAVAKGASHMEPIRGGRLNPYDAHFFGCHVAALNNSCQIIYGSGADSICKAQAYDACQVVQPNTTVLV